MIFPPQPLRSVFELLLLLECLNALSRSDKQVFSGILMAPVRWTDQWPEQQLVGTFGRIYRAPADHLAALKVRDIHAFLAARWEVPLELGAPDDCWCFDNLASGRALEQRFTRPKNAQRKWLTHRWPAAVAQLDAYRARIARLTHQLSGAPAWEKCPICSPHRELWFGAWPFDDEPSVTTAPVRARYLHILGTPVFHDRQDRGWCLKKCLHCLSIYLWKSDYDYLVNGASESTETLTRLTPEEAAPWLTAVEQRLTQQSQSP